MHIESTEINLLTSSSKLPLHNKRIVVTAPRNYACRLSEQIIKKGGLPILMPTIETCYLSNYTQLDNALSRIKEFDWIIFTSRNGIIAFFQRMNDLDIPVSVLENCQLCALGKDSESLLSFSGKVDLIPKESSPAGIVAELKTIVQIDEKKVLVPAPEVVGLPEPNVIPNLITDLENLGIKVTRVPAYITQGLDKNIYSIELDLIRQGKIDVIAFSSTAEIESFLRMVNSPRDYGDCAIACFGPYTTANAQKLGMTVSIVSQNYSSFEGFAEAIAKFFAL
ncbi:MULTISPECIES: uroporphyrinogen-III synthase [Nostoc]|uniref:Uroporphyrinogen-III synthase n=1 Tax=Nostoc paludosum FACHB-159 TaxID=2692908 RepID=A0ABR8KG94_9NOSO|nr:MULTISPECIES: uroporphyrinogen-III synthase [Nostoc]MBD2679327.1 uroporphyrinogen-III synthase [Nostoc sp. FACHB-857]MBD2738572.1 uroporphyrinogen-III synthase [Nostoc paludosum FACHB-159]